MNKNVFSKSRVETFSDGIFAIIVTLLVLEIKVPHIANANSVTDLRTALIPLLPKVASWIISFFTVCVIWVNHHRVFSVIGALSNRLFWLNASLLLWVSFIPFPTALMGDYPQNPLAVSLYGIIMTLMAFSFFLMRKTMIADGQTAHTEMNTVAFGVATRMAFWLGVVPYVVAACLSWVIPLAALVVYFLIPLYFMVPWAGSRKYAVNEDLFGNH